MKVSQTTNYSPSMRAEVHFAKPGVLFNKKANYLHPEGQKISSEGIRYFEDTKVPAKIKDKICSIPLVKKLAQNHDVFVNYDSINYYRQKNITRIKLMYADYSKKLATTYTVEGIADNAQGAIDIAFQKLHNLRENRVLTGELNIFEKLIEKVKKLKF